MPVSDDEEQKRLKGYVKGKRVWIANNWDGALLVKRLGDNASRLTIADPDGYDRLLVRLADGTTERIRKDLLRLTPPPGQTAKRETVKATKPRPRKEAVDPVYGVETTIFDHLEAGS